MMNIKEKFQNSKMGKAVIPAIAAFGLATMPFAAQADCQPLRHSTTGVNMGAAGSSYQFSNERKGNVGIAIYAGQDLKKTGYTAEQIGNYLVKQIESAQGVDAECFIHDSEMPRGSSVYFMVNGLSVPRSDNGVDLLTALDKSTINTVKGEATLVKTLVSNDHINGSEPTVAAR